jgi:hypothetical protein
MKRNKSGATSLEDVPSREEQQWLANCNSFLACCVAMATTMLNTDRREKGKNRRKTES